MTELQVYDTTLRDGAQQEGLNLSVADKLVIAGHLDELGVGFIEGGWPGANPKDTEFFARAKRELNLSNATLAAFGATRRAGTVAADDPQVRALVDSGASVGDAGGQSTCPPRRVCFAHNASREPRDDPRHRVLPSR